MKLGSAFSDTLVVERKSVNRLDKINHPAWWFGSGRSLFFASILIVSFFILTARLFDLTVLKGHQFRLLADGNRVRELIRHAPRGLLLDRTGRPLVSNTPSFRLIKPCASDKKLCSEQITAQEGMELEKKVLANGEFLEVDYRRNYLAGSAVAHVLGYTGELNSDELSDEYYSLRKYKSGDKIGRDGAEAVFEEKLRGRDGKELIEVDARGNMLRTLGVDPDQQGNNITLSLDVGLSEEVARVFPAGEKGAVVVTIPQTGEILALYSSPSYNPNLFTSGLSEDSFKLLFNNPDLPLFNRAIGGVYPPGSTFKIITALAALAEGAITPDTIIEDVGVIKISDTFTFANWYFLQYGRTDGNIGLVKAIARSNDIYFYKTGERLGITKLASWAKRFGIGKPLGVELAGEAGGLMPDPVWKNERFSTAEDKEARNNEWYVGDTYHVAIGQGYLLVNPLHVNLWTASVANNGKLCKPTIEKVSDHQTTSTLCRELGISQKNIDAVTSGMIDACSPGGTGWPLFNFKVIPSTAGEQNTINNEVNEASPSGKLPGISIPIACKTGTAEYGDLDDNTHAWFTAFAPVPERFAPGTGQTPNIHSNKDLTGQPEIVVTVLIEGAGEGSEKAAPVAKKIFEYWFTR